MFPFNLPNLLTVLRILLVPVIVVGLLAETPNGDKLAAVVFALAAFTDTGLRMVAAEQGVVIAASPLGKLKTITQVVAIFALIAVPSTPPAVDALVYIAVATTVVSGADYFFGLRRRLDAAREQRASKS